MEWESLPEWDDSLDYFHATYQRKNFQLTDKTDELFFKVEGTGQLLGRQFSVVSYEPFFKNFHFVMEGNNEVDIDGTPRRLDYLGSEDSFTFSWGFRSRFAGLHAGMPYINKSKELQELLIYRFHDHMPIRFNKSLEWRINWSQERYFFEKPRFQEGLAKALASNSCWVDYATVFYWYQKSPGEFKHEPLLPYKDRQKVMKRSKTPLTTRKQYKLPNISETINRPEHEKWWKNAAFLILSCEG